MNKLKKIFDIHGFWIIVLIFIIVIICIFGCCASKKVTYDTMIFEFDNIKHPYHIDNNNLNQLE